LFVFQVMINMTVLNGMSVTGEFEAPPVFHADAGAGQHLHIEFAHSLQLWPWSGYLVLYMSVLPSGQAVRGQASELARSTP
jgi:membrane-bound transcription factor site-1 protease